MSWDLLSWIARLGAVTEHALAARRGVSVASARGTLLAGTRSGLLRRERPLTTHAALYTLTRNGLRACGCSGLEPCRIGATNASHLGACAEVAVALERSYPDCRLQGERELRRDERALGQPLASARLAGSHRDTVLHRPDLVLWPRAPEHPWPPAPLPSVPLPPGPRSLAPLPPALRPLAIEVELTLKAPRRLRAICTAWARSSCVAGVIYVASSETQRPLQRAIAAVSAQDSILVVALAAVAEAPR